MELGETLSGWYNQVHILIAQNIYVESLVTFAFFVVIAWIAVHIVIKGLQNLAKKTKTEVDDRILKRTKKYIPLLIILYGLKLAIAPLGIGEEVEFYLVKGLLTLAVLVGAKLAIVITDEIIGVWGRGWAERTKSTADDQLINLLYKITNIIIIVIGILIALDIWGINITPMLAGLGIAGIAVAFAMQNSLSNLFGGISIIIDKSVKVGDIVELDKDTKGTVLDVGLRSTRIKTFDNEVIIVPNGKLADSRIKNYAHPDNSARLVVPFNVAYGSDVEKVKKLVLDELKKMKEISKEPKPYLRFTEMGQSSLNLKAYMWLEDYRKRFAVKDVVNTKIYNALNKAKVTIPFPQLDVHLKKK